MCPFRHGLTNKIRLSWSPNLFVPPEIPFMYIIYKHDDPIEGDLTCKTILWAYLARDRIYQVPARTRTS